MHDIAPLPRPRRAVAAQALAAIAPATPTVPAVPPGPERPAIDGSAAGAAADPAIAPTPGPAPAPRVGPARAPAAGPAPVSTVGPALQPLYAAPADEPETAAPGGASTAGVRRQGPREKLRALGAQALVDAELLALVLGSGVARRSALRTGRLLARRPLPELAQWSSARWLLVPGVGPARGAALVAAFELGRRAAETGAPGAIIRGPEDVLSQVRDLVRARKEHFVVLLLNARHELQSRETISIGSLNASIVHPREVFQPAILHSAASVVLVHNHPSGDPEPSEEDLEITRRLTGVGELVGIGVLDHVIVAHRGVVSLRARELM